MTNKNWFALGIGKKNKKGKYLDMYFHPDNISSSETNLKETPEHKLVKVSDDIPPSSVPEAYLKLHLISLRLIKPNETNLDGIFGILPNVAWTSIGPVDVEELAGKINENKIKGSPIKVFSLDKFPSLLDYVSLIDVRIADASRVRLGAYLGAGTTVMHEGFVNFNAGTLGEAMVEGRISQGVVVDENSDIGGGASTMGTLSGGNNIKISIGKNCLLGANSGLGIPLGDRCTIEAGLYLTSGAKIEMLDETGKIVESLKAKELSNKTDLLFIRNSLTGAIQCKKNLNVNKLNEDLHDN
ncbi:MAG: tetrahydrodipicolinate N-succinyltransferase N-terminal domain-containing protein [Gammaproteobacteria bacterium]|jgi:2,3,4,5-tetrahydropyridine-2-carboxylate N-succinyltransferase|nr:MAG: 2,3,4,5-tetrahydropyridine-2,6-carboxylate N-succinyltransferase [Gammaproteobacteria bacterium]|tara:strand:+ start:12584 stop:13477 length:894 start_codon:yes stop_codon:yes gene_type:complete